MMNYKPIDMALVGKHILRKQCEKGKIDIIGDVVFGTLPNGAQMILGYLIPTEQFRALLKWLFKNPKPEDWRDEQAKN